MSTMKRYSRNLAFVARPLVAVMALSLFATPDAQADTVVYQKDEDGWTLVTYYNDEGKRTSAHVYDENDKWVASKYYDDDNPNPDDGTTTPGDISSWKALLKQKGGGMQEPGFEKTPLGRYLARKGKGIGPLHNPNGDDSGGGPSPGNRLEFEDPLDDALGTGIGHLGSPGGIDGNGGPIRGQLKNLGRKKGTGRDPAEGSGGGKPQDGGLWGPEMPGPPELVNPNPARTSRDAFVLVPVTGGSSSGVSGSNMTPRSGARTGNLNFGAFGNGITPAIRRRPQPP
ncbi:MAG: hypothetical protein ACE5KM_17920, partial [Planctomycetaceae bacterium]